MKTLVLYLLRVVSSLASAGAFAFGIYLLVFALTKHDSLRTCGGGDCEEVLNSSWSVWYGIPVVTFGVAMYGSFFIAHLLCILSRNNSLLRVLKWILTFVAALIVLGAVYFFVIQAAILHAFCRSCMITHGMGVLSVISGWIGMRVSSREMSHRYDAAGAPYPSRPSDPEKDSAETILLRQMRTRNHQVPDWVWCLGLAATFFALFVVLHIRDPGPQTHLVLDALTNNPQSQTKPAESGPSKPGIEPDRESDASLILEPPEARNPKSNGDASSSTPSPSLPNPRMIEPSIQEDDQALRIHLVDDIDFRRDCFPTVGARDAPYVIVKLFDYQCNSCRAFHNDLKKTLPSYEDHFTLILVPCPLERKCHPDLPKSVKDHVHSCQLTKIALALWRIAPDRFEEYHDWAMEEDRDPEAALARAVELVDRDKLTSMITAETLMDDIKIACQIFGSRGGERMPKVFLPSGRVIIGVVRSRKELRNILDEEIRILAEREPGIVRARVAGRITDEALCKERSMDYDEVHPTNTNVTHPGG